MDFMTLLTLALLTVVNLAALYIDNRNRAIKYREIGEAINNVEGMIAEVQRQHGNTAAAINRQLWELDQRLRKVERVFSPDHQL